MSQGFIDVPEVVQINKEHRKRLIGTQRAAHADGQAILHHMPIAHAGQGIVTGGMADRRLKVVALDGVIEAANQFAGTGLVPDTVIDLVRVLIELVL